jgi:hypothetical protein
MGGAQELCSRAGHFGGLLLPTGTLPMTAMRELIALVVVLRAASALAVRRMG